MDHSMWTCAGLLHMHFSMVTGPSWHRSRMHTRLVLLPTAIAYRGTAWWRIRVAKPFAVLNNTEASAASPSSSTPAGL